MRKRDACAQAMAVVFHLPWPVDVGLAAFFYLLFHWMSQTYGGAAALFDPSGLRSFIGTLAGFLACALPVVLVAGAVGSVLRRWRQKN